MHDLFNTFVFRLLVPERILSRAEIEQRLFHGSVQRFTPDDVQIVGTVNNHILLITEDEEKTMEIMLLTGAKLERIDRDKIKGLTDSLLSSK